MSCFWICLFCFRSSDVDYFMIPNYVPRLCIFIMFWINFWDALSFYNSYSINSYINSELFKSIFSFFFSHVIIYLPNLDYYTVLAAQWITSKRKTYSLSHFNYTRTVLNWCDLNSRPILYAFKNREIYSQFLTSIGIFHWFEYVLFPFGMLKMTIFIFVYQNSWC